MGQYLADRLERRALGRIQQQDAAEAAFLLQRTGEGGYRRIAMQDRQGGRGIGNGGRMTGPPKRQDFRLSGVRRQRQQQAAFAAPAEGLCRDVVVHCEGGRRRRTKLPQDPGAAAAGRHSMA